MFHESSAKFLCGCIFFLFFFLTCLGQLRCWHVIFLRGLLVFISNEEWLSFCIYSTCARCHCKTTTYESHLIYSHTNVAVLLSSQYILIQSVCNIIANYGFCPQLGLTLCHLVSDSLGVFLVIIVTLTLYLHLWKRFFFLTNY